MQTTHMQQTQFNYAQRYNSQKQIDITHQHTQTYITHKDRQTDTTHKDSLTDRHNSRRRMHDSPMQIGTMISHMKATKLKWSQCRVFCTVVLVSPCTTSRMGRRRGMS